MMTIVLMAASFVGGVVFCFLFLRSNPKKAGQINTVVNQAAGKNKSL